MTRPKRDLSTSTQATRNDLHQNTTIPLAGIPFLSSTQNEFFSSLIFSEGMCIEGAAFVEVNVLISASESGLAVVDVCNS